MKIKLKNKAEIAAFNSYVLEVEKILRNKKREIFKKPTINDVQTTVLWLEIIELQKKTLLAEYKAGHNIIKKCIIKITPTQAYIIILYLKEYQSSGDKKSGTYVSHFIKEQSAHIWKELLTN